MPTFASDYAYGTANELKQLSNLNKYLNTTLHRRGGFNTFDYDDEKSIFVELKTRRCRHDRYPTAIVGQNKVNHAKLNETEENHFVFAFCYEDGLYAIEYEPDLFSTFESNDEYYRGARDDIENKPQKIIYIPTNLLVKIE
jgi:hypothetical protein